MIWFTSDFHFGHDKDFILKPRGFINWAEAGQKIITNYNELISWNDDVYILGDCMLKNDEFGMQCLRQLVGYKHLIIGNHDSDTRIEKYIESGLFIEIQYATRLRYKKYTFWLSHYPMKMGNFKERHPVYNLCGHKHTHNKFEDIADLSYHVELEAHNNYPVSIETIIKDLEENKNMVMANEKVIQ